jgi:hypothetical protein
VRVRGHVVCVDAEGIVVGVFRQHTSRRLDPQLHTHAVIANRVRSPDGRWLALDARTLKLDQRTLSALYHVMLRTELTRRLGVVWREPVNGIAEIDGIDPEVLAAFSQRTGDVERRLDAKLDRFRRDMGREPTQRERWRLEREAVVDSRPAKDHHADTAEELHEEWRQRLTSLGVEPRKLVSAVIDRQQRRLGIDEEMAASMVDEALESLTQRQSAWRPAELVRELSAHLPTTVTVDPDRLVGFLQRLADHTAVTRCVDLSPPVLAGVVVRRDGRPITEAATTRLLTTQTILDQEEQLMEWAQQRRRLGDGLPLRPVAVPETLSGGQVEVCAAVAGSGPLELIVGPAGTGKTTALTPAVTAMKHQGRAVFGIAPTAAAAEVLASETGMQADTVDKFLYEHTRPNRPPAARYGLPVGATVIVDEAGTLSTPNLDELARLADHHQWRIVLVGDPRQFSAVGRGGMFSHLTTTCGAIELDQVHRFTHQWEGEASLRLRNGDPTVLVDYDRRGRLHDGTAHDMERELLDAWRQARVRGEAVAVMANRTATVTHLNQLAQSSRVQDGELDPHGPTLVVRDERLLVGDEVVTRHNQRRLRTDRGVMVKNRDHWTVTAMHDDRSVTVTGRSGTVRLPAGYVARHVELGYAQTSHATQGRTVDTALLYLDTPTDTRGVYTPMTRGRHANHAYVVTDGTRTAVDVLTQSLARDWIDHPALARIQQLEADPAAVPVWSSLQTTRLDRTQHPPPHRTAQEAHSVEPGPAEQPEHERRVWRRLAEIQHRAAQQRSAERTVGRDTPGLER